MTFRSDVAAHTTLPPRHLLLCAGDAQSRSGIVEGEAPAPLRAVAQDLPSGTAEWQAGQVGEYQVEARRIGDNVSGWMRLHDSELAGSQAEGSARAHVAGNAGATTMGVREHLHVLPQTEWEPQVRSDRVGREPQHPRMVRIHGGDMVKVILVGHGYFGSLYRERINKHDNLKLVGVVDKDLSRLVEFRGTNLGESYEMCADSIDHDAVIVCTPPQHHASISISALERGKNVLCMKPGAMSEAEAEAVTKAVNVGNGRFFVDYTMLHAPELDFVTGLIGMVGSIGGFSSARHVVTGPKPEGIVRDLLCHDVALLEHLGLTSGDLKVTCAMTSGVSATAIITSPNGERIAYMNASYNSTYARKDTRFKAENMRSVTNPGLVVTWDQNQKSVSVTSQGKSIDVQFRHDPDLITRSLNTFADPWYSLLIEGQEYRRIMRIIHALQHSADNDGIVVSVAS